MTGPSRVGDVAADSFVEDVVKPALKLPRGEPRVRALFDAWIAWGVEEGCIFVAAAAELDDREGPARDAAVAAQRDWMETLTQAARAAVQAGHFRADLDLPQFVFELESIFLGMHFMSRFVREPSAETYAERAIRALLERTRA